MTLGTMHPTDLNQRLLRAAMRGEEKELSQALVDGAGSVSHAFMLAAENGHAACVELLLEKIDAKANQFYALMGAVYGGHAECVKLLIHVSDPKAEGSRALSSAARRGDLECVKLLLPVSDALANHSQALRWAAERGNAECVALLLRASDPVAQDKHGADAATKAREQGHGDVAAMIEAFVEARDLSAALPPRIKNAKPHAL